MRSRPIVAAAAPRQFHVMLGLPLKGWLRFFVGAFAAAASLLLLPFKPMGILALFVMAASVAGAATVAIYMRSYEPWSWRRLWVRPRLRLRAWRRARDAARLRAQMVRDPWRVASSTALGSGGGDS